MSANLILNKLKKPDLTKKFIRKESLSQGLSLSNISLVCAPAGSGKSSVISDWINQVEIKYLWYSLDEWDNDFAVFLSYIFKGLEEIDLNVAKKFQQFSQTTLSLSDDALIKGIIALLHEVKVPWLLVFDDYHQIFQMKIHEFINHLLQHLPRNLSLCIISREDPPIHLARLRAQKKLFEIRMSSLKFSLNETEKFFECVFQRPLNREQISYLYERSEGWIAGIQLIAMTLEEVEDLDFFIKNFSQNQDYIMDYLLEEVLHRHSEMSRDFLLKTSIFSYFNEDLCAFVLEIPLETVHVEMNILLKSNSFISSLNREKKWFRYHHLFKSLLNQQLKVYNHLDIKKLYQRAGLWYENKEIYQESIAYYLKGDHFEAAQRLIENRFSEMDMNLNSASWLELVKHLPQKYIETSPVICLGYGWALLDQGRINDCEDWFMKSEDLYKRRQFHSESQGIKVHDIKTFNDIPILLLSSKAYVAAIKRDYDSLLIYTDQLNKKVKDTRYTRQWIIESFMAMMYWGQGNIEQALAISLQLKEDPRIDLNDAIRDTFTWIIAELYIQLGQLTKAKIILEDAIEGVEENNILPVLVATYYLLLAGIESLRGHRDQAYKYLETSKTYGFRYEFMDWRYKYHLLKSRLYLQEGLYDQAKGLIHEGRQYRFLNPAPESLTLEDLALWLTMVRDEDESKKNYMVEEARNAYQASGMECPPYRDEMQWKIILSHSYGNELIDLCRELLKRAKIQNRLIDMVDYTLILKGLVKDKSEKTYLLNTAKAYSKKEGILQPFIEFDQDYVRSKEENKAYEVQVAEINEKLEIPLTGRERDLLTLIAKGLSNQEIANHLFITLSTVKSYNNKLFSKLAVKRRTEAVAKAKALGLLL